MSDQAILNSVRQALALARIGVNADNRGDYTVAISNYREASNLLNSPDDLSTLNDEHYQAMLEKSKQYQARADVLESLLNQQNGAAVSSPTKENIVFVEETLSGVPTDPVPAFASYKPFWLMRVLSKTITTGAYLTPKLYIPKSVWQQTGCKMLAITIKIQSLMELQESLSKLKVYARDDNALPFDRKNIDAISKEMDKEEKGWAGKVKKLGTSLAKGAVRLAPSSKLVINLYCDSTMKIYYILVLVIFINVSQSVELWKYEEDRWMLYAYDNEDSNYLRVKVDVSKGETMRFAMIFPASHTLFKYTLDVRSDDLEEKINYVDNLGQHYKGNTPHKFENCGNNHYEFRIINRNILFDGDYVFHMKREGQCTEKSTPQNLFYVLDSN
ncbi:microtubule interacting and transport domain-containing protein [Heterostelium album PN500]|uniref:Microtubule interacting and transport domain-containing protein n=1 Tax=Heterostelium pallidum (strain ATCC 26659 / Pp 5 / PN500) TaxID=670386 RepID=D3BM44_HETP5|nr:microtubule interacting and transport domain-containing protein [Heterostelium album PN500]EFA77645.1 microtubule interacting and transport domain-containing protein [Heterostelium album PN500]|eukprot:XP_020429773.1 microtubule interacting and transport domain-containing protein [Heterostelium album PN500]